MRNSKRNFLVANSFLNRYIRCRVTFGLSIFWRLKKTPVSYRLYIWRAVARFFEPGQSAKGFLLKHCIRVCLSVFTIAFCILSLSDYSFAQTPTPSPIVHYKQRTIGYSLKNKAITAHVFGEGKKKVLMIGGMHGDETSGADLAKLLTYSYKNKPVHTALTLIIVPAANPDGLAAVTRVNARGVDINRNFPSKSWRPEYELARYNPGLAPASEPETKVMMKLIEEFSPHLIITFHAPLNCVNWDGPAQATATILSEFNHYPLCQSLGYETPGSLGQFAGKDRQIPVITIELAEARVTPETMNAIQPLRQLLDSYALENLKEKPSK
jgi:hypothetical protein